MDALSASVTLTAATAVGAGVATAHLKWPASVHDRLFAAAVVLAIVPLVALGTIWPSAYSVVAVLAAPALLLCGVAALFPRFLRHTGAQAYCVASAWLSFLSWATQVWWLGK